MADLAGTNSTTGTFTTDIYWPDSLPQRPLVDGYQESPPDNTMRTQMDEGPAKVRRRYTANVRPIQVTLEMDADELNTFDDFYVEETASGSRRFIWQHPRTKTQHEMRFRTPPPPDYTAMGGLQYQVSFTLEIMPESG